MSGRMLRRTMSWPERQLTGFFVPADSSRESGRGIDALSRLSGSGSFGRGSSIALIRGKVGLADV